MQSIVCMKMETPKYKRPKSHFFLYFQRIIFFFIFFLLLYFTPELVSYLTPRDLHRRAAYSICESSFLIHHGGYHDLFVCPW